MTRRDHGAHLVKKIEQKNSNESLRSSNLINMFMCGDVMAGRGIDQILPHPGDPLIHEPYMRSAKGYVEIAEKANA